MAPSHAMYYPVEGDESLLIQESLDAEKLLSSSKDTTLSPSEDVCRFRCYAPRVSVNFSGFIILLFTNLLLTTLVVYFREHYYAAPKKPSSSNTAYSPVLNFIDLPFSPKRVDARLYPNFSDPAAIYMGKPSKDVDDAWNRIEDNMIFGITRDDVVRIGKDPGISVKFNPEWGQGDDLYMAEVDVFHQIHCLNSLRKALIFNYEYYYYDLYGFEPPLGFEVHARHCTSILLQSIMCHSDVEVVTHVWHESTPQPYPDFGVNRQCRDFDQLLRWKEESDLPHAHRKFGAYRAPEGATQVPAEPAEVEVLGNATGFKHGTPTKMMYIKGCNA
ncbi:hypothetical protein F5Y13DRAFT_201982 [Hypoxylon sp. FL1857]|nr:hypothetical protein F5Y13DRAFT_201982 [Hypoxylon sp. FL1857]